MVNAQPYQGGRKGADRGIDALLCIEVGKNKTEKVIVQVKGGAHVTRANIATLKGDVEREKAAIGLFVTLMFLFVRVLPMISIFEVRMLLPKASIKGHETLLPQTHADNAEGI